MEGEAGRRTGRVAGAEVFVVWALAIKVESRKAEDMEGRKGRPFVQLNI